MSAASLPEATLVGLQARLKSTTEFTLVIDTNVLFSLLTFSIPILDRYKFFLPVGSRSHDH